MHVWWKLIWLHSIGQANQKAVLSIASMQSIRILMLEGLGSMPPRRLLKITCSEIEYEGILKNIQCIAI